MSEYTLYMATVLLVTVSVFVLHPAQAASHPVDFHEVAKVTHKSHGHINKAYGYVNVTTDINGAGTINVMFSNGSRFNGARFNACVKFLDASGIVIKQEHLNTRVGAGSFQGAGEGKISKPLGIADFDSIQVDFYLSDIPELIINQPGLQKDVSFSTSLSSM